MANIVEIKLERYNWWGNAIYRTKLGTPIVQLEEGFILLQTLMILIVNLVAD